MMDTTELGFEARLSYAMQARALEVAKLPGVREIDMTQVLTEGAESLGETIAILTVGPEAAVLGGLIGKSLLGAIIGASGLDAEKAFQNEVLDRLKQIEITLKEILVFLKEDLRPIVREEVEAALASQTASLLSAKVTTIGGLVNAYDFHPKDADRTTISALGDKGTEALELGKVLMAKGQDWHGAVCHAFAAGFASYARVINTHQDFKYILAAHAEKYHEYSTACLAPAVPKGYWNQPEPQETLTMAKVRIDGELAQSSSWLNDIRKGRVTYLLSYDFRAGRSAEGELDEVPSTVYGAGGWIELQGEGLNGDDIYFNLPWPGLTERPTPQQIVNKLNETHAGGFGWLVPGFLDLTSTSPYIREQSYNMMVQALSWALNVQRKNPPIKKYLDKVIPAMESLAKSTLTLQLDSSKKA
jgi:hypothetical protein